MEIGRGSLRKVARRFIKAPLFCESSAATGQFHGGTASFFSIQDLGPPELEKYRYWDAAHFKREPPSGHAACRDCRCRAITSLHAARRQMLACASGSSIIAPATRA